MSLAGRRRKSFWGSQGPVWFSVSFVALAAVFAAWNSNDPTSERFWGSIACSFLAAAFTALDQHWAGKKSKVGKDAVANEAFEILSIMESAVGKLSANDQFKAYFAQLVEQCGPKLFQERVVRLGFFVLEAGEAEDVSLRFLRKRAAVERGNAMPLTFQAGLVAPGERDQAKEMIMRAEANKDLWVKNIYKDSYGWKHLPKGSKNSYNCFISAPVLDWTQSRSQGLLTVDARSVGDLTDEDKRWVRMLAKMLSHGLRDEVSAVPVPRNPVGAL